MEKCSMCNCQLEKDDVALSKKMLGKKIRQFLCKEDLAMMLNVTVDDLEQKIEQFKEEGCTLFL